MNKIQNIPTIIVFHYLKSMPLVKEMHLFFKITFVCLSCLPEELGFTLFNIILHKANANHFRRSCICNVL